MGRGLAAREAWGNWCEFFLTTLGYMVGIGNIWRFPYICYSNGGGAFLIPFIIFMFVCAVPVVFLEMSYSQFASLGPGRAWRICPLFKGVGVGMSLVIGIVAIYYNVVIAWALYYLYMSLRRELPWNMCDNNWNTPNCSLRLGHVDNSTNHTSFLVSSASNLNQSFHAKTPTEEFWTHHVLEMSNGIETLGNIRWPLFICHVITWVVVFLCALKGIKSFGKVAYFTATAPYLLLIILLIRGAMLPGAMDGLKYYLIPQWDKLKEIKVWTAAAMQIFYSVGCGGGGSVTLASYNKFNNNIIRDALLFPLMDTATCLLCGLVIFVVLGYMSHATGLPIDSVVAEGPGIAFMVYPEALAQLPLAPMWSAFFFLVLFMVGLDSQFVHVEIVVGCLTDMFPQYLRTRKMLTNSVFILIAFFLAIPCLTQGGVYVLQVMDWYALGFSATTLASVEMLVISYIYGVDRLFADIEVMIGRKPSRIWKPFLLFLTPATILFILLSSMAMHQPVRYGDYSYPGYAISFGWFTAVVSLFPIPLFALWQIARSRGSFIKRVVHSLSPSRNWGPNNMADREVYMKSLRRDVGSIVGCFGRLKKPDEGSHSKAVTMQMMEKDEIVNSV
ncbi:sodium- and chloride-dependent glycine transporter 1-like [Liolophura sinensis]|uniref:sodium- and chloride-dependent glycine transporter 1-like n=1 Tax=Liolophura sinensis TaxID=3198878 RepID=UPI00315980F6